MKSKLSEFKKQKGVGQRKGLLKERIIGPDQPFDYDDVASITGPDFVQYLHRDITAVVPYEKLKKNFADFLVEAFKRLKYTQVSGFQVPDDFYHHLGHGWAQPTYDGWIRIGSDDFISKVFGPADTIRLPREGDFLMQGEVAWTMIRNANEAPIRSPVSGVVCALNDNIRKQPSLTYKDPYGEGWLFFLNPVSLEINMKELCQGSECFRWIEKEKQKLLELLGPRYARLAETGGRVVEDVFGHFPEIGWDRLVRTFL